MVNNDARGKPCVQRLRSFFVSIFENNSPAKVTCWPDYCFLQASPEALTYCFEGRWLGARLGGSMFYNSLIVKLF